jgi:hypothetical protein
VKSGLSSPANAEAAAWPTPGRIVTESTTDGIWVNEYGSGILTAMKTTVELPDPILRRAQAYARERGLSFKEVLIQALDLLILDDLREPRKPGWQSLFGSFAHEGDENRRILKVIEDEFSSVDLKEWQ